VQYIKTVALATASLKVQRNFEKEPSFLWEQQFSSHASCSAGVVYQNPDHALSPTSTAYHQGSTSRLTMDQAGKNMDALRKERVVRSISEIEAYS
jgi:hypothetical protein